MFRATPILIAVALAFGPMAVLGGTGPDDAPSAGASQTILVGFEPGGFPTDLAPGESWNGHKVKDVHATGRFAVLEAPGLAVAARLGVLPGVAYIEEDGVATTLYTPNDGSWSSQWGPKKMGAPAAWDTTKGSTSVTVAVLDTGIRASHVDLSGARLLSGYDFANGDSIPEDDCYGHGTHVAGTIGATTGNGKGVAGMAQVKVLPVKVMGDTSSSGCYGSHSAIAKGIYYAVDNGASVVSMSLGSTTSSSTLKNAVDYAASKGVLVVAAAGNNHGGEVMYPARYGNAIAVSAVDSSLTVASFSAKGSAIEIAAPGKSIISTGASSDTSYVYMSGTSMATPHVAGALALAKSAAPGASASELRSAMQVTATDLGASGRDIYYGYGFIQVDKMVAKLGGSSTPEPTPDPQPPEAWFLKGSNGLKTTVDGSPSSDPEGGTLSYTWKWSDGTTSTGQTATHTWAKSGSYSVTLTVKDAQGLTDSVTRSVSVEGAASNAAPNAWFLKGSTGLKTTVDGDPSSDPDGDTLSYTWKWSDGTTSTGQTATHTWAKSGSYSVTLTVKDAQGLTDSVTRPVSVEGSASNTAPNAWFLKGSNGLKTTVDGNPSNDPDGDALSYTWKWSDGTTSTGQTATHTWAKSGSYSVTLTVKDAQGLTDSVTRPVSVEGAASNAAPNAWFLKGSSGLKTTVDGSPSNDPDGDALSYTWKWSDGTTSTGQTATHTWATGGSYSVTLTVKDAQGAVDSVTRPVSVQATASQPEPEPDSGNTLQDGSKEPTSISQGGWAHYQIEVPNGASQLDIDMTGPSCTSSSCGVDGDLYVKFAQEPTLHDYSCRPYKSGNAESCSFSTPYSGIWHVSVYGYKGAGTVYLTPSLTGADANGAPTASFDWAYHYSTAYVDATSSTDPDGDTLSYTWDWGDGSGGSGMKAQHTYASAGSYTVELTVTDSSGHSSSQAKVVKVD